MRHLRRQGVRVLAVSGFYATPCMPAGAGPDYVNAAARLACADPPERLLARLHATEQAFGRARAGRWGGRTLDLDLLAADGLVLPDRATHDRWRRLPADDQMALAPDRLILPHPRLQDRAFVLVPLADVAPDWRHPVLGLSVRAMLRALPAGEVAQVRPLPGTKGDAGP
ncbi:MAG: 2-amino-4-hydroxy-6-hydroxymethyldihydropteridine diphosphokinase [Roseovarius sp.]